MSGPFRSALIACLIAPVAIARAQPPSDTELGPKIDAVAAKALAEPGAAGLSVAVGRDGEVIFARAYGFGLAIKDWEGRRRISHGGGIFGFSSMLLTLPDDGLTVAVLANSDAINTGKVADAVARVALGLAIFEPRDLAMSPTDLACFSGEFAFEGISLEIRFFERDGTMWAQATGQQEKRLPYQGAGEFRASFDTAVKFVSTEGSADSFVLHQGGGMVPAKRKK